VTAEGAGREFEEWWADLSPEFDVDPDYPLTDDHKDMARAGWDARDEEVTSLREENQRLRAIETAARGLVEIGNGVYAPTRIGVVISPGGWDALQTALTPPEEVEQGG
jgi:hypothetical protein